MKTVNLNNMKIGEGTPKICVPIVAKNYEEAFEKAKLIKKNHADLIEFRGDFFDEFLNENLMCKTVDMIKETTGNSVIFTFRTKNEGGEQEISKDDYKKILVAVIEKSQADIIDLEYYFDADIRRDVLNTAHENNKKIIFSNHDFNKTPKKDEIVKRLKDMENIGGDIAKIAVMPENKTDVMNLMQATIIANQEIDIPIVTMSMGKTGVVSRICGEMFGSSITFGASGKTSAPGQIDAEELRDLLNALHKYFGND